MTETTEKSLCSVCGKPHGAPFFTLDRLPVLSCALWPTAERGRDCLMRPVELVACEHCGMVENAVFDRDATEYSELYENALHFSKVYRDYSDVEADRIIDRLGLRQKDVFEIGSGDGRFLSLLCDKGENRGRGFDPSYAENKGDHLPLSERVTITPEYYSERHADLHCDLVMSRHVLEHIPGPGAFMRGLRKTLDKQRHATIFFEVPDANYLLGDHSLWDVIYEHCSYFTRPALERVFADFGFDVREIRSTFQGQCLTIEAGIGDGKWISSEGERKEQVQRVVEQAKVFGDVVQNRLSGCRARLEQLRTEGKKVALWGAGARAVVYLNMADVGGAYGHVVDLNPRKHGTYLPGCGLRIEKPQSLADYQPDVVMTMNPIYEGEIRKSLDDMGVNAPLEIV